jgi:protein-S-isoprenylcysteine O-methyltransferase Ste14
MIQFLNLLGWLACVIYATIPSFWLFIHPHAEYWRSRSRSPYRVLLPLWVGMWIIFGLIAAPWRHIALYHTWYAWVPAIPLLAAGLTIYKYAGAHFSAAQLGGLPELSPNHREQRLVTAGIHAHVRHPVYLAHLCEMLAWSIGTGLAVCYGLTAFAVVTGVIMIRMEDKELGKRFGREYSDYRSSVPAVIPRLPALKPRSRVTLLFMGIAALLTSIIRFS